MDISINAKVDCSDDHYGHVTHVILKPTTEKITHLVVSNGIFPETEFLVPIQHVAASNPDLIQLDCSCDEVSKMPIFDQVQFIPSDLSGYMGSPYMMWPYSSPEEPYIHLEKEHIPADELVIRRGADVEAKDGHVGRVDEFLIDPETDHITHLVMREGHLWGQKDVTVPVSEIDHYQDNVVFLKLDKLGIEALPAIPIHHRSVKGK
jgi:sporulation protein YlmC with PRC-barrel domain